MKSISIRLFCFHFSVQAFRILPWRHSELFFKAFIKISQTAEANGISDLTYIITFRQQQLGSPLQTNTSHKLARCLICQSFDLAIKLHPAAPCLLTEIFNREFFIVDVTLDHGQNLANKLFIQGGDRYLFWLQSDLFAEVFTHFAPLFNPVSNN